VAVVGAGVGGVALLLLTLLAGRRRQV